MNKYIQKPTRTKTPNGAVYYEWYFELFKCWVNLVNTEKDIHKYFEYENIAVDYANFKGMAVNTESDSGFTILLNPTNGADITTLAHEAVHITTYILRRVGYPKQNEVFHDELEAYLMELIVGKFKHLIKT